MKKGRLGIALCIAFSCTALAAVAGTPDEESARASFCSRALQSKLKIGINPDHLIPFAKEDNTSDLSNGYSAFKGVMIHGLEHFSLTMANSNCSLNSLKGWKALNSVMAGALEQLEVTMNSHVCPQATPPVTPPPLPKNSPPVEIPVGVIVPGETPDDKVLTIYRTETEKVHKP